jgi:serine/threonine protein phosphatase PrpC
MNNLEICCMTDIVGRSTNEDRVLAKCFDGLYLLAVADGIGGHAAGEVASGVAMIEVEKSLQLNLGKGDLRNQAKEALARANKEIYLLSRENSEYTGMGTTMVMALVQQGKVLIANVGDSRAYSISGGQIRWRTKDHSAIQELLETGTITEEEARQHPLKGTLTRALGMEQEVKLDLYDIAFSPRDILMLCSDGLTDSVSDEEIRGIIVSTQDLETACSNLVAIANEKGGEDNISIILARKNQ